MALGKEDGHEEPTFGNPNELETTVEFPKKGVYDLKVTASNGYASGSDTVTFTVNEPPLISFKGNTSYSKNSVIELVGVIDDNGLGDPKKDGDRVSVLWEMVSGPGGSSFSNRNILNPIVKILTGKPGRDHVRLLDPGPDLDRLASRRARLYEFGDSAQILNHVVNATVLFLDLRGFTKTSEGQISERDLTTELYTVFDAFVPHIRRFGGRVDKFLGDGMMVTLGTEPADPLDPLNAVRAASSARRPSSISDGRRRRTSRWGWPSTMAGSTWPASSPTRTRWTAR